MTNTFGGIEAGGTKFVCLVGRSPTDIQSEVRFPTTSPRETLQKAVDFFEEQSPDRPIKAVGIGSFGPVDLNIKSPSYGYITTTPKPGWHGVDIRGIIQSKLKVPVTVDTDVNAAALGEFTWGAAQNLQDFLYLTVGTGIGGGGFSAGNLIHGLTHPEMGHIWINHNLEKDPFPGSCPYHGDCFEGLATGPAMQKRWGVSPTELPSDHPGWDLEAQYIAMALANYIYILSPQRIILGGGVMQQKSLLPLIHQKLPHLLNDYIRSREILESIDSYIVPPGLGNRSGVLGAIALAQKLVE